LTPSCLNTTSNRYGAELLGKTEVGEQIKLMTVELVVALPTKLNDCVSVLTTIRCQATRDNVRSVDRRLPGPANPTTIA
jgi:hypothetical protein